MDKTAIKPDVFADFRHITDKATLDEAIKKGKDPEDIALGALVNHDGWKILVEYINNLKRDMDMMVETSISNGSSFEDIGKVTVITNLCKEKLNAIIQRVNDSRESIEQSDDE